MFFSEFNGEIFISNVNQSLRSVYPGEGDEDITAYPSGEDFREIVLLDNRLHWYSTHFVIGSWMITLNLSHSILKNGIHYYSHFRDEKTESQKC